MKKLPFVRIFHLISLSLSIRHSFNAPDTAFFYLPQRARLVSVRQILLESSSSKRFGNVAFSIAKAMCDNAADDPDVPLTYAARRLFTAAFLRAVPTNTATIQLSTFAECAASPATTERDPRWDQFYKSTLVSAAVHWVGAGAVLHAGGEAAAADTAHSVDGTPLGALVGRLDQKLQKLLQSELDRFWAEERSAKAARKAGKKADSSVDSVRPPNLRTPENLALQWTLLFAAGFAQVQSGRTIAATTLLKSLFDVFRSVRVPGEAGCRDDIEVLGIDDWIYKYLHIAIFWSAVVSALHLTSSAQAPGFVDVVAEFPTAPMPCSNATLQNIPPPSQRSLNGPILSEILASVPPFTALGYLKWIDPLQPSHNPDADTRAAILDRCFSQILKDDGLMLQHPLVAQIRQKMTDYTLWLRTEAQLSQLDVLVATELRRRGKENPMGVLKLIQASGMDENGLAVLLANGHLDEAIKRRESLLITLELVQSAIPADATAACIDPDLSTMDQLCPGKTRSALVQLIAVVAKLRKLRMVLSCPDPFDDMLGDRSSGDVEIGIESGDNADRKVGWPLRMRHLSSGSSSSSSSTLDGSRTIEESKLAIWLSSPYFAEASRNAISLAATMRSLAAQISAKELVTNYVAAYFFSSAAVYAAWLSLLLLRRFGILAASTTAALPELRTLHEQLESDAQACLDILALVPLPQYTPIRVLLASVLSGDSIRFSLRHVQMLRMSGRVIGKCPHCEDGEGECYACHVADSATKDMESAHSSDGEIETPKMELTDPMADAVLGIGKCRVRFIDDPVIWQTYGSDDYKRGESVEEEIVGRETLQTPLQVQLDQRAGTRLPNLRAFW